MGTAVAIGVGAVVAGGAAYQYKEAKDASEEAEKAQKEYQARQQQLQEEAAERQEKEKEELQAGISRTRRKLFAEKSISTASSLVSSTDVIYATESAQVSNSIPNIGGINI